MSFDPTVELAAIEPLQFDQANPLGLRDNPFPARVTVVEKVYYESVADPCREIVDHSYSVYLQSDEQPWGPRRQTVTEQACKLDLGFLAGKAVSELVVVNLEGMRAQIMPTPAQIAATAGMVVYVSRTATDEPFAKVRPGRSMRLEPVGELWVSCPVGRVRIAVSAAPGDA